MLITTLVVSFLVFCMLDVRCGWAGVVSGLQARAQRGYSSVITTMHGPTNIKYERSVVSPDT